MASDLSQETLKKLLSFQTELISAKPEVPYLLNLITNRCLVLTEAEGVVFELLEDNDLVYRATAGVASSQIGLRIPMEKSFSGLSIQSNQTLYCADSELDPRVNLMACRKVGLRSMVVQPLIYDSNIIGVLKVYSKNPNSFSEKTCSILELLSGSMSATLNNANRWADSDKSIQNLSYLASHDPLTGILNRSAFYDNLRRQLNLAKQGLFHVGVALFDLDGLKFVNDNYGHQAGDHFIIQFVNQLSAHTSESETLARLGGDEFGFVYSTEEPPESIFFRMETMAKNSEGSFEFEMNHLELKTSVGVAVSPVDGFEPETLVNIADTRLYEQKRSKKKIV
ncbi:diguanylate cyclase [Leptospira sp. 96542]|nr:diguanylate cyclase [Leptospira sp. 96542]